MKLDIRSRWSHLASVLVVSLAAAALFFAFPSTRSDVPTIVGFVASAATFVALLIAIVEILRLQNLSSHVEFAVTKAIDGVSQERAVLVVGECRIMVETAIAICDAGERVPTVSINKIISSAHEISRLRGFNDHFQDADLSMMMSYAALPARQQTSTNRLKVALCSIYTGRLLDYHKGKK